MSESKRALTERLLDTFCKNLAEIGDLDPSVQQHVSTLYRLF